MCCKVILKICTLFLPFYYYISFLKNIMLKYKCENVIINYKYLYGNFIKLFDNLNLIGVNMKKWIINKPDESIAGNIQKNSNLSLLCAEVLVSRGMNNIQKINDFFGAEGLENPFNMIDMHKAVDAVNLSIDNGQKICIYGDYDCDGISSTVMLYSYLECIGADVMYYIPERSEGYGMNMTSIKKLSDYGVNLIITVDNGISASQEADYIYELGMKLVITDHHQPGNTLPRAEAVINPHRTDCPSAFKPLCGAGVALKLIAAMDDGSYDAAVEQFAELAAIATIADIVPLNGENRYIAETGISLLPHTEKPGILALIEVCGLTDKEITSSSIGFMLAPRINASGRFGSPKTAAKLLLCDDYDEALELAKELDKLNTMRKKTESSIMNEIENYISSNPSVLNERVLVFSGENWHHGVIGIVAAKLVEKFCKPCFVVTIEGSQSRGSARSFGDFSVFDCLNHCSDVFIRFGGHKGAGGFSLETQRLTEFKQKIFKYALDYHDSMPIFTITADKLLMPDEITLQNVESLKLIEPFGESNPKPVFLISKASVKKISPLSNGIHTKLLISYGSKNFSAFIFRISPDNVMINSGDLCDFIVTLEKNTFKNSDSISLYIKDWRKSGIKQSSYLSAKNAYEKYLRNESLPDAYYPKICPSRNEMISVYKLITNNWRCIDNLFASLNNSLNYCKLRASIDILSELNIVQFDAFNQKVKRLPVKNKVNLESSENLMRLRSKL